MLRNIDLDRLFSKEDHQSPESKPSGKNLYYKFEPGPSIPPHTKGPRTMTLTKERTLTLPYEQLAASQHPTGELPASRQRCV
ncbi:hypothetical protein CK820_G0038895 [Pan troglodytes]|uniref:Uncharacterized protein n=1 Tax=Pan troglodytes TaxID=9598 RepID=A0A2J8KHE4_PANTR|nr:hypothetical protein CK820_G0038895 [Pan troglodytes]